jgi:hypothetical protein
VIASSTRGFAVLHADAPSVTSPYQVRYQDQNEKGSLHVPLSRLTRAIDPVRADATYARGGATP